MRYSRDDRNELFGTPLNDRVIELVEAIRQHLALFDCAQIMKLTDDTFRGEFVTRHLIKPPTFDPSPSNKFLDDETSRASYVHRVTNGYSLRYKPTSSQFIIATFKTDVSPTELAFTFVVHNDNDIGRAKATHAQLVTLTEQNVAQLVHEIIQANSDIERSGKAEFLRRREECEKRDRMRSSL